MTTSTPVTDADEPVPAVDILHAAFDGDDGDEPIPGRRRWSLCRTLDVVRVGDRRTADLELVTCRRCLAELARRPRGLPYRPPFAVRLVPFPPVGGAS